MRVALLIAVLMLFASEASAQFFCKGCGCKGGSGWRHNETGKCIGCKPELSRRCSNGQCTFEGQPHLALIKRNCPNDVDVEEVSTPVRTTRPLK